MKNEEVSLKILFLFYWNTNLIVSFQSSVFAMLQNEYEGLKRLTGKSQEECVNALKALWIKYEYGLKCSCQA